MAEWALSHNSGYAAGCVSYCKERGNNTSSSIDKEMDEIQDSVKTIWLLLFYFLSFIKLCQTKLYCLLLVNMFILYLVWNCIVVYLQHPSDDMPWEQYSVCILYIGISINVFLTNRLLCGLLASLLRAQGKTYSVVINLLFTSHLLAPINGHLVIYLADYLTV